MFEIILVSREIINIIIENTPLSLVTPVSFGVTLKALRCASVAFYN